MYCDSVKSIQYNIIGIANKQIDSLYVIIAKGKEQLVLKDENIEAERKRGRRRGFWGFIKGTVVGALVIAILTII